jgi:hypothetical protein
VAETATPKAQAPISTRQRLRLALVLGALAATVFTIWPRGDAFPFCFEVTIRSSLPGFAQLYYDTGTGVNEHDSTRIEVEGGNHEVTYRFSLPAGSYSYLRFDPIDQPRASMTLSQARITDRAGRLLRLIDPGKIKASNEIEGLQANETQASFTTSLKGNDPILAIELGEPLFLKSNARPSPWKLSRRFVLSFLAISALAFSFASVLRTRLAPAASHWLHKTAIWATAHPRRLVIIAAALSVLLSCYPVAFFGKSFISPNNHSHTYLLYGEMPTVPGSKNVATDDEKGSDLGAIMWYSWPASVVESRALLKDHELPLWNRYDSAGLPLLGQGQSMFGDPLHWLVLLSHGAAGWWDVKFLLAKFLFAASLGLCVLQLTKHRPAAVVVALSAPFIGFFSYRYSHPAFFSMCYAPLIVFAWISLINAPNGRRISVSLALMVLANWMVITSGTVKEAYVLYLTMNLCGVLTLLVSAIRDKAARLGLALAAQLIFIAIAAPLWLTFLNALRNSWTVYNAGAAFQLQPSLIIGLFDDIFYRQFNAGELHLDPSSNFLVLGAVLWFCLSSQKGENVRFFWGPAATCLLALAFVFGILPASLITRLPFIGRIYHVDNTFSDVAIVCLLLLAGFGIRAFWNDCLTTTFRHTALRVFVVVGCLALLYLGSTEAAQRSTFTLLRPPDHVPKSAFFWGYSLSLLIGLASTIWWGRQIISRPRLRWWQPVGLGLAFVLLHWRNGMHLQTPFDAYIMNPQQRTSLIADSSPTVKFVAGAAREPARAAGLDYNLAPGYGGAIGIEEIDAPDPLLNRHYKSLVDAFGATLLFGSSNVGVIDEKLDNDLPLFDMLNVRYYLGHPGSKADSIPSLRKVATLDLNVYESAQAWPRAFFVDRYTACADVKEVVQLLKAGPGLPFAAIQNDELANRPELQALGHDSAAQANKTVVPAVDYKLTTNTTSFRIKAPSSGVVVLTESYIANDFQVRVNNKPASYFLVDGAFKAIFLPEAGDYSVFYSYWPKGFTASLWMAGGGLILLCAGLVLVARAPSPKA